MTTLDATLLAAQADAAAPARRIAAFLGKNRAYWRLLIRGNALVMGTLGIYRFWLMTDMRRFLWSNTELAGETFEYAGTARELLLGFLVAISILVPLYAALFIIGLTLEASGQISTAFGFLIVTVLGHYAVYRARRYRLTRTIYRGVRFDQSGSPWRYAVCAVFWWTLILISLGLAYPFAQSRLERFKLRHTSFGNLAGRFEGTGLSLFLRGVLMWFLTVVPLTIGMIETISAIDWKALAEVAAAGSDDILSRLEATGLAAAIVFASATGIWALLALALFYPIFQTMVLRWWVSGLRFGEIAVTSRLRTAQVFGVYARFLWYSFLFSLLAGAAGIGGAILFDHLLGSQTSLLGEIVATAALVAAYVAVALGYSTIYQATVKLGLWRCVAESLEISDTSALDRVSAAGQASSPLGEGLADALNVGGI